MLMCIHGFCNYVEGHLLVIGHSEAKTQSSGDLLKIERVGKRIEHD